MFSHYRRKVQTLERGEVMTRQTSTWRCVICGKEALGGVVCFDCEQTKKAEQRREPGTVTYKQVGYIEHLLTKCDTEKSRAAILSVVPYFEYDYDELSEEQAGSIIGKILEIIEADK
jgi:hypothetical protein